MNITEAKKFLTWEFPQNTCTVKRIGPRTAAVVQPIKFEHLRPGGTVSESTMMLTDYAAYATADLGVITYETIADSGSVIDEGIHLEIVRPGTGDPVPDGEVVVTSLNPDCPSIRFAPGDMSAILAGQSTGGRTSRRIRVGMGRADQTAKVRGMFIHPEPGKRNCQLPQNSD